MEDEGTVTRVLRGNWHLLLVLTLILGAGIFFALRPSHSADAEAATVGEVGVEISGDEDGAAYTNESRWAQPTKDTKFQEGIVKYEHEVVFNHDSAETPANTFKLANLYFSTGDYKNASKYYCAMLAEFPRFEGMRYVYQNLVACYDKLGKDELRRSTLREMMKYFGPDTPEYRYAQMELDR